MPRGFRIPPRPFAAESVNDFKAMPIDICISVDIEFSIGGTFTDPARHRPVGERMLVGDGRTPTSGLDFLLDTLAEHELRATFFVETANSTYFGEGPMRSVTQRILEAGQDVQLHLHPAWTYFADADWPERLPHHPPDDSIAGRRVQELEELLGQGIAWLRGWGADRPVAFRSGNLQADRALYEAMARLNLVLGSNLGIGIERPDDQSLHLYGGRHWIDGVLELPVLTYKLFGVRRYPVLKCLTVLGTTWGEMRALLYAAVSANLSPVILLTHAQEFVIASDIQYTNIAPNPLTRGRFRRLCALLNADSECRSRHIPGDDLQGLCAGMAKPGEF